MQACEYDEKLQVLIYPCPNCELLCTTGINEINCCIFRHGFNVKLQQQIQPHESKDNCDKFRNDKESYVGCCKPYQIVKVDGKYFVKVCDYI